MNRRGFFGSLVAVLLGARISKPKVEDGWHHLAATTDGKGTTVYRDGGRVFYVDSDSIVADKAYFASRVEVLPGQGLRVYDINSSFPVCMQFYYPDGRRRPLARSEKALLNRIYGKHGAPNHVA